MLTARHCGADKDWRSPYSDALFGHTGGGDVTLDAVAIHSKNYSPYVYVGSWNNSAVLPIRGTRTPVNGMIACTSGSWSGTTCRQKVTDVGVYEVNDEGNRVGPGIWTTQTDADGFVGEGDSGGPLFQLNGNGDGAFGLGMIEGRDGTRIVPCKGRSSSASRKCSWRAFHINLNRILTEFDMTIQTAS